jgi:hypothetical protein
MASDFEKGLLIGVLIGEGHFGGDGRQPHVTLRMHVRHEALFDWIGRTFPGGKLYGPYDHGGRHYYQWMARGSYLRDVLLPILDEHLSPDLDAQASERYQEMKGRYGRRLGTDAGSEVPAPDVTSLEDHASSPPEGPEPAQSAGAVARPRRRSSPSPAPERSSVSEIFERLRRESPG